MPSFGPASLAKLKTIDPRLQYLLNAAIQITDFTIVCGHRNKADQDAAVAKGNSLTRWPTSNHNSLPSQAVDVAPWPIDWNDHKRFYYLAGVIMALAQFAKINVRWGGTFKSLVDLPHFELV